MTTTQKSLMYSRIHNHGMNLLTIFPNATEQDPVKLCKRLRMWENKAARLTLDESNTGANHYPALCKILTNFKKLLFGSDPTQQPAELYKAVFINGDPRGYALKINDRYMKVNNLSLHSDWGGYGILAPDFTPNN
jgi:hypothetical protein